MAKSKKSQQVSVQKQQAQVEDDVEEPESQLSQEDDDAALLTSKVEEKLLSTLAKIKMKDPSIYDKSKQDLFEDSDFDDDEDASPDVLIPNNKKFTYKDMVKSGAMESQDENGQLPPAMQEKKAKQSFKNALKKHIEKIDEAEGDLFKIAKKITKKDEEPTQMKDEKSKFKDLTKKFDKQSKKLIKKVWKSDELDETDLFLKDYILDKKWLSSKYREKENDEQVAIDEEDEQRSQEMDAYEAEYNFRFEEPGGTTIIQYPRQVQNSLRQKPETRKQKRKKTIERKKQEELEMRKEAQIKKESLKKEILQKLVPETDEVDHDWFFCDDCCKPFSQYDNMWQCSNCPDYMLCDECYEIIIHKHPMTKSRVPQGSGAPSNPENILNQLKTCKTCRRKIPTSKNRYQWTDRSYIVNIMCEDCFDSSKLEIKKKYKLVAAENPNLEQILQQNPEKIKELTNHKEIQEMVDEYIKNDFQGVISGGVKTKFRYISVPAESYGLSDEQILFGEDKELNKYVSVKRMAPYNEEKVRLKNNVFNKKIKSIKKSVKTNKQLLKKGVAHLNKVRLLAKMKNRASAIRNRQERRLRILNLSNKEKERNHYVSSSRLMSYGIKNESQDQK